MKWQDIFVDIKTLSPWGCLPLLINIYCIKSDFKEIFLNLHHMTEVTRGSCWHQNFVLKGLSAPALGLYTCIKSWKKMYKIIQRGFFSTCSKWSKWQVVSVDIKILSPGVVCPWSVAVHINEKMCIKSEIEEILFKLATNDHSDEAFLLTENFWP